MKKIFVSVVLLFLFVGSSYALDIDLTGATTEVSTFNSITLHKITVTGMAGTYWATLAWDPASWALIPIAYGQEADVKTNTIRTFHPGDYINYTGTGTISQNGYTANITGTASFQILSSSKVDPITQGNCLELNESMSLTGPGGSINTSTISYFAQSADGSLFVFGDNMNTGNGNVDIWLSSAPYYYRSFQSPMAVGQSDGAIGNFTDGSTLTYAYQVIGTEYVTTALGSFEAYKITSNANFVFPNGNSAVQNNTEWYVPGLGPIKITWNASYYLFGQFQNNLIFTATMNNTNIGY